MNKYPLEFKPPVFPDISKYAISIFLAGSIEMGGAMDWQKVFVDKFRNVAKSDSYLSNFAILNPRREQWNSSWEQTMDNGNFFQQVTWELTYLERSKVKVFYFAPNTMSPISLLEFGKFHSESNVYLCVDPKYKRAGNLDIFCHRYKIRKYETLDEIIDQITYKYNSYV